MKGYGSRNAGILLIMLVIGAIVGGWLGAALSRFYPQLSIFQLTETVGLPPTTLDLYVVTLTLGFLLKINLFSILGLIAGYLVYRKM